MAAMQAAAIEPIDTRGVEFLSYPPPIGGHRSGMEESWVSVGPDVGDPRMAEPPLARSAFPLQLGKVQRPVLPHETLRRDRLLDWLARRADKRVVLLIAEAGFGKTTLIGDHTRRSRLRSFWYRLDEDDTDGLVFLRYLVASCQQVDRRLLPRTSSVLNESTIEPIRLEMVLETLLAELSSLGDVPSALILDDVHSVEDVPSIAAVIERLVERAPRGLTIVVAGRRSPAFSLAAHRARGEVVELGRDDLRFDSHEIARLFAEAYKHPLDQDVLAELHARTDGWAASLQLVKTAVEGMSMAQVRAFVNSLSAAEGDLYDFLAEEVVGDLDPALRDFLLRAALLEEMDPGTAAVAGGVAPGRARFLLGQAERLGLLGRSEGSVGSWRAHPLVREFLLARLELELGPDQMKVLHRLLAAALEPQSWRLAARHWAAAGDAAEVKRVICGAVPAIIGTGDFAAAEDLIARFPDPAPNPWYDIIRSRQLAAQGRYDEALALARRAAAVGAATAPDDPSFLVSDALNRLYLALSMYDIPARVEALRDLQASPDAEVACIARASELIVQSSVAGSLDAVCQALDETLHVNRRTGNYRHEAVTLSNLAAAELVRDNAGRALECAFTAARVLGDSALPADLAAVEMNAARALARLGRVQEARSHARAIDDTQAWLDPEALLDQAEIQLMYDDPEQAGSILEKLWARNPRSRNNPYSKLVEARLSVQEGSYAQAHKLLASLGHHDFTNGFLSAARSLQMQLLAMETPDDPEIRSKSTSGICSAEVQQAWFWSKSIRLTKALVSQAEELVSFIRSLEPQGSAYLSIQAELVVRRLGDLDPAALDIVRREAILRPERWRWALRQMIPGLVSSPLALKRAVELLELTGNEEDVKILRAHAKNKRLKMPDAGHSLARRLAPRAFVDDLGRITIHLGGREIAGTDFRKKALALLAYLLTRPQHTASREQVIEALWPDMEPEQGANSLNQTAYFLRQVFEPKTDDDATAGYLNCRGDLMWLDEELISSRSSTCLNLIAASRRDDSPELVTELAETYTGRFASDFMYDDWACAFRETLHASYLDRVERSILLDTRNGEFDRAIAVAQLALAADPEADQIELCLLRLYRQIGAQAAAAEQYTHYASVLREQLGMEPPPLDSL
jgi:ATP/maltotriose-dependent transcriptional regulator MalT/DNA-binding SARP family transcriptional activator